MRYKHQLNSAELSYMTQTLNLGNTAFDIGAHKGAYLYWMLKAVGSSGSVHAFEPQIRLANYLNEIKRLKSYSNLGVYNFGLSDRQGESALHIPKTQSSSSPSARLESIDTATSGSQIMVRIETLDNWIEDTGVRPDLLKIDVEGHELQVLNGCINYLRSDKPSLLIECEDRHLDGENVCSTFNLLVDIGYRGYFFVDGKKKSIDNFDTRIHQRNDGEEFWKKAGYINNFIFES